MTTHHHSNPTTLPSHHLRRRAPRSFSGLQKVASSARQLKLLLAPTPLAYGTPAFRSYLSSWTPGLIDRLIEPLTRYHE